MKTIPEHLLEFVPVSDEQLYQNPLLLFKLIPYSRKYRCLRQRADKSTAALGRQFDSAGHAGYSAADNSTGD